MDYQSLFDESDFLHHSAFSSMIYRKAGTLVLPGEESYPLIFVLQGSVKMFFPADISYLAEGELVALHRTNLQKMECTADTIILKYCPPSKIEHYFDLCRKTFHKESSTPVPILATMATWIDSVMKELSTAKQEKPIEWSAYELRLNEIIVQYPPNCLGELYVPFTAYWHSKH